MLVQAIQRHGSPGGTQRRASNEIVVRYALAREGFK